MTYFILIAALLGHLDLPEPCDIGNPHLTRCAYISELEGRMRPMDNPPTGMLLGCHHILYPAQKDDPFTLVHDWTGDWQARFNVNGGVYYDGGRKTVLCGGDYNWRVFEEVQ